jgi:NADH:ubiquinone oxidoreductase subunit E
MHTLNKLKQEYPNELRMVPLECMAACDEAPVAMVEYDFFSRIVPQDFYEYVKTKLAETE